MKLKQKQLLGNILLSGLTVIFFFSVIFLFQSLGHGPVLYTAIEIDVVLFVIIVYAVCKTCKISIKYERSNRLDRSIPYLIFLALIVNITGLLRLSGITFLEHFIQLTVLTVFFGTFIYWVRRV